MAKLHMLPRLISPVTFPSLSPCNLRLVPSCSSTRETSAGGNNESFSGISVNSRVGGWRQAGSHSALGNIGKASLLETEAPLVTKETLRSGWDGSFETDAAVGRVECNGRGCRPICDEEVSTSIPRDCDEDEAVCSLEARTALYISRRATRDLEMRPNHPFSLDFAEFANDVWRETAIAAKFFDMAMKKHPNDGATLLQYAQFAWKTLGDFDKADELFQRAIEESSIDSDANAAYALFLWQTEED